MLTVSSCQTIDPFVVEECPIVILPAEPDPELQSVPFTVEGTSDEDRKYILDNEGFLIYSENIENLVNYGRNQKGQVVYYTVSINECKD